MHPLSKSAFVDIQFYLSLMLFHPNKKWLIQKWVPKWQIPFWYWLCLFLKMSVAFHTNLRMSLYSVKMTSDVFSKIDFNLFFNLIMLMPVSGPDCHYPNMSIVSLIEVEGASIVQFIRIEFFIQLMCHHPKNLDFKFWVKSIKPVGYHTWLVLILSEDINKTCLFPNSQ